MGKERSQGTCGFIFLVPQGEPRALRSIKYTSGRKKKKRIKVYNREDNE